MSGTYNFKKIEADSQQKWDKLDVYKTDDNSAKARFYGLVEFPYPSGAGLHVGHPRPYTAMDVITRKRRMEGFEVLFPIGFDAFGLPTENYAIKTGRPPAEVTAENIENFTRQIKSLGFGFDWSRAVDTTDPQYYKWTQWLFLKFFEHDLAYKKNIPINWCLSCKIGLANEEVVDGACERCGGSVEKRDKEQWMLAITKYADKLLEGLDAVDYITPAKVQQQNWIGRSEGANVVFRVENSEGSLEVFTTRPDTLFGATYMVVAPEHEILDQFRDRIENKDEVSAYIKAASAKSDLQRTDLQKEKTGVELKGLRAINPASGEAILIWVADYVLSGYGSGAIMAVPGHDQRDWEFAQKYSLPIVEVISGGDVKKEAYVGDGVLVNSDFLDGQSVVDAKRNIMEWLQSNEVGSSQVNYKLRDWVFSRQRYWGEPIPLVFCEPCGGWISVPEDQLPVLLPEVEKYEPTDSGESPLAAIEDWVNTECPNCGGPAKRETDTMPNWAGSSWYFLRYCDPHNEKEFASKEALKKWMPVNWYNGGMEHTVLHLLYSRFWNQFLFDIGLVPSLEPYKKRTSHGMILAKGGEKMSKSKGNVVNPDEIVEKFGADVFRVYEMFMGPFDQAAQWDDAGLIGVQRFLNKVFDLSKKLVEQSDPQVTKKLHQTIQKVTDDIEQMHFNTAIAAMMQWVNGATLGVSKEDYDSLLKILSPFAPHLCEHLRGGEGSIVLADWPSFDENLAQEEQIELVVQVNGKVRDKMILDSGSSEEQIKQKALSSEKVQKWLVGGKPKMIVVVRGKLVNIVI